jgi:hypothetical protein
MFFVRVYLELETIEKQSGQWTSPKPSDSSSVVVVPSIIAPKQVLNITSKFISNDFECQILMRVLILVNVN